MALPPWVISITFLFQFPLTFRQTQWDVHFHCIAYDYSWTDWDNLMIIWEMFHGKILLRLVFLLLLVNFVSELELMYIYLIVSTRSILTHLLTHLFSFLQTEEIFWINKRVLKAKSPSLFRNLAPWTFGDLLIVFWTKVNLLYLLYSGARRCCLLCLIKQNCLLKTFWRTPSWWLRHLFTRFPF